MCTKAWQDSYIHLYMLQKQVLRYVVEVQYVECQNVENTNFPHQNVQSQIYVP
jgi:hypothetical protein